MNGVPIIIAVITALIFYNFLEHLSIIFSKIN